MDAVRVSDNKEVVIKRTRKSRCEGPITEYFSTPERVSVEANHCVRVYEVFCDEEYEFIVMPLLRKFDEPPFETVEQAIDFVSQTLEVRLRLKFQMMIPEEMLIGSKLHASRGCCTSVGHAILCNFILTHII